jgi:uncharacterized membrane protein YfcA
MSIVLYLGLGAVAGLIAGLFGVGGGLVIVPVLLWAFTAQGFDPTHLTHLAVGTSLATIIVTSLSSVNAHHRRGAVRWAVFRHLAPGLLIGSFLGAMVAGWLPAQWLQFIIGCFALWVAWSMFRGPKVTSATVEHLPSVPAQVGAGAGIGVASAIFGIGGGSLTVPYLSRHGVVMQQAVATSSACGLPIALAGALGFMVFGANAEHLPAGSWGFVNVYAFVGISTASLLTAQFGARLAHRLPAPLLKRLFSLLLLTVGLVFVYKSSIWQLF